MSQFDGHKSPWTLQWNFFWIYFAAVKLEAKAFYTKGQLWTNFAISGVKSERALKDINIKLQMPTFQCTTTQNNKEEWVFFFTLISAVLLLLPFLSEINLIF